MKLDETTFNKLLPENIRIKSNRFFTPKEIALQAAAWLAGDDKRKVLDIGAGIGKFCLFGAYHTGSEFVGIELRRHLVDIARNMFETFGVSNAKILHGNITDFQFSDFSAFYLYNPYHENIVPELRMDDSILLSKSFYGIYTEHTKSQLALARPGTRLVTYYGSSFEAPPGYKVVDEFKGGALKYWVKLN